MKRWWFYIVAFGLLCAALALAQQAGKEESSSAPGTQNPETGVPVARVGLSAKLAQALRIKSVPPEYPKDARRADIQGQVVLKVLIDKEGNVEGVAFVSGHPMLAPAAVRAVKQWKYKPYLLNGEPVYAETHVTVNFALSGH